jgi:hypothetical protein
MINLKTTQAYMYNYGNKYESIQLSMNINNHRRHYCSKYKKPFLLTQEEKAAQKHDGEYETRSSSHNKTQKCKHDDKTNKTGMEIKHKNCKCSLNKV